MSGTERRARGVVIAVLAVPLALTVVGAVLVFLLPFDGYEPGEELSAYRHTAPCSPPVVEGAPAVFELRHAASLSVRQCAGLTDDGARAYAWLERAEGDAGAEVHVGALPWRGGSADAALERTVHELTEALGADAPELISTEAYAARGRELGRRDLSLRAVSDTLTAGRWLARVIAVPRPTGEGGVVLVALTPAGERASEGLPALSRVVAPIVESVRF